MKGSVRKRGQTWSYRIDLGIVSGKRKQMERGGYIMKQDAEAAMVDVISSFNLKGKIFEDKNISFHDVYEEFITSEAPTTRKQPTIKRYHSLYSNHLEEAFGGRKMASITPRDLQCFLTEKAKTHSMEYVRSFYNLLLVLFKYATRMEYLRTDPTEKVMPPKSPRTVDYNEKVYTIEELKRIRSRIKSTNLEPAFMLGSMLGVRPGECFGLRWADFDFEKYQVKIERQLQRYNHRWTLTTLKTPNSYRTVSFGENLKAFLLALKEQQQQNFAELGHYYKTNTVMDETGKKTTVEEIVDFINVKPDGEMLNTYSTKYITRVCKDELNIPFKPHNLRHTHATLLLEQGMNPKYVQERLGHAKLEFTLRLYTHVTGNMHEKARHILDESFKF